MSRQHSFLVDEVPADQTTPPRAVVLLLGWWGASIKHLTKYAKLYQDRNCLTVQATAEKWAVLNHLSYNNRSLDECALIAAAHIAKLLDEVNNDKVPVVFHAFSNGGAYLIERLEILIQEARDGKNHGDSNKILLLLGERLQGQVFDSAPAYPSAQSAVRAMSNVFSSSIMRALISILVTAHYYYDMILHHVFGFPNGRNDFYKFMANSRLCLKQAYIYSAADDITDVTKLEELIASRQKISDDILVKKFDDSLHVQHLRMHEAAYNQVVERFLDAIDSSPAKAIQTN
jgi:hypothetical protein